MRYGATIGLALLLSVASWLVLPGAATAPAPAARTAVEPRPPRPDPWIVEDRGPMVPIVEDRAAATSPSSVSNSRQEIDVDSVAAAFLHAVNEVREAAGAPRLHADDDLATLGHGWAVTLAEEGRLRHSSLIHAVVDDPAWTAAGENVGYGPSVAVLVEAFVESPSHRANIVDPRYRSAGIGVAVVDGVIWTTHLFAG